MNFRCLIRLTLLFSLAAGVVRADDGAWVPVTTPPLRAQSYDAAHATLGKPIPVDPAEAGKVNTSVSLGRPLVPVSYESTTVRAQAPDVVPPPGGGGAIPPPPVVVPGNELYNSGAVAPGHHGGNWFKNCWDGVCDSFERRCGQKWMSDHAGDFDHFASPVSSPFLAEDPRSLTEIKPLFIYQNVPSDNPFTKGGSIEYFGVQARLALTERWSIVLTKFGGIAFQPDDKSFSSDESGFAEIWVGPKFTFLRDETHNTAAAVGLNFQIPKGSEKVFQDTGSLTLAPYFSFAKSFGRLPQGWGNFNIMSTSGVAIAIDDERSDYFFSQFHLDFDVAGQHRFYPMVELNWLRYFNQGGKLPLTFEGGDLINFGSTNVEKANIVTLAVGARYKVGGRENVQIGGAFEFPLTDAKDLNDFRVTLDVIFRY